MKRCKNLPPKLFLYLLPYGESALEVRPKLDVGSEVRLLSSGVELASGARRSASSRESTGPTVQTDYIHELCYHTSLQI